MEEARLDGTVTFARPASSSTQPVTIKPLLRFLQANSSFSRYHRSPPQRLTQTGSTPATSPVFPDRMEEEDDYRT
jgi:hypothetical protein